MTLPEQTREQADVVFWDLYSPRAHPGFWTMEAFTHLRRACRAGSSVHTYSSATAVRSALLLAGFAVGTGLSTGEKSQTTVAAADLRRSRATPGSALVGTPGALPCWLAQRRAGERHGTRACAASVQSRGRANQPLITSSTVSCFQSENSPASKNVPWHTGQVSR